MRHDRKVSLAMCLFLVAGCILQGMLTERQQVLAADTWEMAETTPYGRYPETVTYTLGKQVSASSGMKDGDSYEDTDVSEDSGGNVRPYADTADAEFMEE